MLTCSPWCMCELWVGLERHNPCVMSCEPPSPFLHSYCLRPSYSSKKQKGRYCIRYWLWDGIILCSTIYIGHDALYAAICWRQPPVPSLCVIQSHSVLSFNTLDYAHIKKVHETKMRAHLEGADTISQLTNLSFLNFHLLIRWKANLITLHSDLLLPSKLFISHKQAWGS